MKKCWLIVWALIAVFFVLFAAGRETGTAGGN
jgi:hypothetical protein